ncbi:hypothetical protein QDY71_09100 [Kingella negevensis]|uniref:Uncharacterized protein n=1 Tax=Kingella negevensis TaxID=1522312 RepID=A0A238HG10_9NEIS|nr:hypothetical protein [Kingella negevensis]MDK4697900.1 hypothetical protein [Kingella negevensis]SNB69753.1 Uncharacterised protein [Kingella negevensis]
MVLTVFAVLFLSTPALADDKQMFLRSLERPAKTELHTCAGGVSDIVNVGNQYFVLYNWSEGVWEAEIDDGKHYCSGNGTYYHIAKFVKNNGRYTLVNPSVLGNVNIGDIENITRVSDDLVAVLRTRKLSEKDNVRYPRNLHEVRVNLRTGMVLNDNFIGRAPELR